MLCFPACITGFLRELLGFFHLVGFGLVFFTTHTEAEDRLCSLDYILLFRKC